MVAGQPVHVIEQHKAGDGPLLRPQKTFHRVRVDGDAIDKAILQAVEIMRLQILRAATRQVTGR